MAGSGHKPSGDSGRKLDALLETPLLRLRLNETRLRRRYDDRRSGPRVSVVMPTWNRAGVIERAIDSVLGQVYRTFELLVVDDGSTDHTREVLERRYRDEERLHYFRVEHGGASRARNAALSRATGDLVAYLDSDNFWSENYLLIMANLFAEQADARCAYAGLLIRDDREGKKSLLLRDYDRESLVERNFIDLNVFVHRRELVRQHGGFREDLPVLQDWELILRYTQTHDPVVIDCALATYCLEEGLGHLTLRPELTEDYALVRKLHPR